jgi:general secretion pathway protein A
VYRAHFKLKWNPFELSPDPRFLFRTPLHNEALAAIYYGIKRHKGIVVLTGEVGTGKTLLLNCVLSLLNPSEFVSAYIFNPRLNTTEFLRYVITDFGLPCPDSKGNMLHELNKFLLAEKQNNRTAVVVIDEAQHLERELLEEIRLLTNLESTQEKLLQIVLAGQSELDEKLDMPELRQLKQRVALRCRLSPFDLAAAAAYVQRRLVVAGSTLDAAKTIFPQPTLAAVWRHSKGIPRLINVICDNALIAAFANHSDQVTSELVDEVARDLRLGVVTRTQARVAPTSQFEAIKLLLEHFNGTPTSSGNGDSPMGSAVPSCGDFEDSEPLQANLT